MSLSFRYHAQVPGLERIRYRDNALAKPQTQSSNFLGERYCIKSRIDVKCGRTVESKTLTSTDEEAILIFLSVDPSVTKLW